MRAIINFSHRCALRCEWCYVSFEASAPREVVVAAVVRRVADLGFTSITIGGGDPFQVRFLSNILNLAKSLGFFVHVDTHGKGMRESRGLLRLLRRNVDLLGLPIDGSCASVHDCMRGSPGHFDVVIRRLRWLTDLRCRIKINTIVSAANISDLPALSVFVANLRPARWSVYQYWPLGPGARAAGKHSVSDLAFAEACAKVGSIFACTDTELEINHQESRRGTYPILHHDGDVFVHASAPENTLVRLGNIFEEKILDRILLHCTPDRPAAVSRYANRAKDHSR